MLQIITGKFFTASKLYVTHHRAVLYSNYAPSARLVESAADTVLCSAVLDTPVGAMRSTTMHQTAGGVFPWIYEVEERLEAVRPDGTPEVLIGAGAEYIVQDFAAVVAFALNITCTPDLDLTRRLLHGQSAALRLMIPPSKYVAQVFEPEIKSQEDDEARLQNFIENLVGLERRTYQVAMRAIRRYVSGLHRIADDLDLAYVLLVASIESLAQGFDAFKPQWEDLPQHKRIPLDKALSRADEDIAAEVRGILLAHEHLALRNRYRDFALSHLKSSYFREEAAAQEDPARRSDLSGAIERAYVYRSKYVHTLRELPRYLTSSPSHRDMAMVEGEPVFTFHGLARIARHVISEFIARAPKCAREEIDYRKELPNIVYVPLAFSLWGTERGYNHESARGYLTGLLEEITMLITSEGSGTRTLTDVRPILAKIENIVPGLAKPEQRLPLLTFYIVFHHFVAGADHRPDANKFIESYAADFAAPVIENLLLYTLYSETPEWTFDDLEEVRSSYYKQRYWKKGVNFGSVLEAAITLFLAELYRSVGYEDRARELISEAVEDLPGRETLLNFEQQTYESGLSAIDWRTLLLPQRNALSNASSDADEPSPG